ncbi:MAG: NAD(P)-binding domain-containing protein [Roseococcus sp.]|nr:NAD(P)-binding domain-containing protein [Roseococcus sp.]
MTIGIIGSGAFGSTIARILAGKGIAATIANRRGPASLAALVEELGPFLTAGTVAEAARADIVFAAMRWTDVETVFTALPAWAGRIVVDCTNALEFLDPDSPDAKDPTNPLAVYGVKAIDLHGQNSSALFSRFVPGARVVKAFNHLDSRLLAQPTLGEGRRVLFYSGDDAEAKAEIRKIIEATGFFPVDLGALDIGGPLASLPFGPLSVHEFIKI